MPFVTRRQALWSLGAGLVRAAQTSTRWALLADTHIAADPRNQYRGFFPAENLKKITPDVVRFHPDGIMIDGDLARLQGLPADYEHFKTLIAPLTAASPVALTLGNHDDRKNFLAAMTSDKAPLVRDKYVTVVERAPIRFVFLDSLLFVNEVPGLLGKEQRSWLDGYLQSGGSTPTLLVVHHTLDDRDGSLLDADRFLRIASRHASVKAVFYGHSHEYAFDKLEGVHLVTLPAVGYNFRDSEPVGWVEGTFTATGCELKLNAIGGNLDRNGKTVSIAWR